MDRLVRFAVTVLFMISAVAVIAAVLPVKAATLAVPDDFPTVQAAIDSASDGDTVLLRDSTFEDQIAIYKSVSLVGEGNPSVFSSITVSASGVQIANLSVFEPVTVVASDNFELSGSSLFGDLEVTSSDNVTISGNGIFDHVILEDLSGLNLSANSHIDSPAMIRVAGCAIASNYFDGSLTMFNSSNNVVTDNSVNVFDDGFGVCIGLNSSGNLFDRNSINIFGSGEGLWVFGSCNVFRNADLNIFGSGYLECIGPYTWNNSVSWNNVNMNTLLGFVLTDSPPSTACFYENIWHSFDFSIELSSSDDKSGVYDTYYKINEGVTLSVNSNGQPILISEGANNTLEYWSMDYAGNEENHTVLTEIKLDKTEPTVENLFRTPNDDVEPDEEVAIAANVTDVISGVMDVRLSYKVSGSSLWLDFPMLLNETSGLFEYTIPTQSQGSIVEYKITVSDNAGNVAIADNEGQYYVYLVIPEFSLMFILPLFMAVALVIAAICRRKRTIDHRRSIYNISARVSGLKWPM